MTPDIEKMVQDEAKKLHQMLYPWHDFDRYPCDAPTGFISIAKHVLKERLLARIEGMEWGKEHPYGYAPIKELQSQLELLDKETP